VIAETMVLSGDIDTVAALVPMEELAVVL
jgi:hypothetical protein